RECEHNLSALLDQQCAPKQAARLHEHLEGCTRCETLYRELQQVDRIFDLANELEPGPALWTNIASRLDTETAAPALGATGWSTWMLGISRWRWAGALTITAALGFSAVVGLYEYKARSAQRQLLAQIDRAQKELISGPDRNPFAILAYGSTDANPFRQVDRER